MFLWYKNNRTKVLQALFIKCTITINKTTRCNPNGNDKKVLDENEITTYSHRSNIPFKNVLMIKICLILLKN